jgi:hypothetical protein
MRSVTFGCSCCWTITTRRPLGSVCISYSGNLTDGAASGRGGRSVGQFRSEVVGIGGGTAGSA